MRIIILTFVLLQYTITIFGQKPPIDTDNLGKWPSVENPVISNDGKYVSYVVSNKPFGKGILTIIKVDGSWKKEITLNDTFSEIFFSSNSKYIIYKNLDSVYLTPLGKGKTEVIPNVGSLKHWQGNWLAYQLDNSNKELILCDMVTWKRSHFYSVDDYSFDRTGNGLLITQDSSHTLKMIDLNNNQYATIWASKKSMCVDYSFDNIGSQIVFKVEESEGQNAKYSIWYYKYGADKAKEVVDNKSLNDADNLCIGGHPEFSRNGHWIFFSLMQIEKKRLPKADATMVNIWSYKDLVIQPEQRRLLTKGPRSFAAAIGVSSNHVIRIEQEDEILETYPREITGDFVVVKDQNSNWEYYWTLSPQPSYYLLSLNDGSRRLLKKESRSILNYSFSPKGKYLVYYDYNADNYFSLDMMHGKVACITNNLTGKVSAEYVNSIAKRPVGHIAGWQEDETSLLLYDNYDIWKVDPAGENAPINVTNWYGYKKHIKFRIINDMGLNKDDDFITYNKYEQLLLTAFNVQNKYNGFYKIILGNAKDPELLTMGPYTYYRDDSQKPHFRSFDDGMKPIKAKDFDRWVVKRQSDVEAPNYFVTTDLKRFNPISHLCPQRDVNWMHAELMSWKMFNGQMSQGILYKPEDFDSKKKYPVIFHYYEKLSHMLYEFPGPAVCYGDINIPWFVSNGYLVFIPDIEYKIASESDTTYGEWAYNSVVSAAEYLSTLPYINGKKMGIQGHSFGGGETNYIVTHTNIFAAAVEAAGITDAISAYLSLVPFMSSIEHYNPQPAIENNHSLTGSTPWERPDIYRRSSAVLYADKVTTPLLIMHNEKDNQIPWRQGVELYMALRRLGKKVWMLQYDNGDHGVYGKDALDYTLRLKQFFDYYLKDMPAPIWMTKGVPAAKKGIEDGLEVDTSALIP